MSTKTNSKRKISILYAIKVLTPLVIRTNPVMFFICIILTIINGISGGIIILTQQRMFDSATLFVEGEISFEIVFISLVILGLSHLFCQLANGIESFLSDIIEEKIKGKLAFKINQKIGRISAIKFEDTEYLDDINKAEGGKNNAVSFVMTFKDITVFYLPYLLFISWYLFSLNPILIISLVFIFLPIVFSHIIRTKVYTKLSDDLAPLQRQLGYFESCVTGREYFKETRLLGAGAYFKKLYNSILNIKQKLQLKSSIKTNWIEFGMQTLTVAGYIGVLLLLFNALMSNEISVGAFATVFFSIGSIYGVMERMINRRISSMANGLGSIKNYLRFLEIEETTYIEQEPLNWGDITASNVTFTYPGSSNPAVCNASFRVQKGETIAIVGENGSGKTTLVRLITGIYNPQSGYITHNKFDIKEISPKLLYQNISAIFQKYQKYQMTLEENIVISNMACSPFLNDSEIISICDMSGIKFHELEHGIKTMLSREFEGTDLSGGQWQRVAIARGIFRQHELIILDEPTSAIDPVEETNIYHKFIEISKNKTMILVTHRIGAAKLADRIFVMKEGRLVGDGSHKELVKDNDEYRRLYFSQEAIYNNDKMFV